MTQIDRDFQRKLKILKQAEWTGHVARTCQHLSVGRVSSCRWAADFQKFGKSAQRKLQQLCRYAANEVSRNRPANVLSWPSS